MDRIKRLNEILVSIFNGVLKIEEKALQEASNHNLSITEIHTLEAIGEGKPKTMTQVAGVLKISVSTLTSAINRLVNKGYVNRFRVPEDRRIVKIELTESGVSSVKEHETFHNNLVADAISDLSPEETERVIQSLENVNKYISENRIKTPKKIGSTAIKEIFLGELRLPVGIFQGGMGIGISLSGLAGAVAASGGLGVISAAQPGFKEADFYTNPKEANKRALQRNIKEALVAVEGVENKGLIGVNIMCAGTHYDEYVTASIEAGAQVIISGAGLPTSLPGIPKTDKVKLVPIVSSARAAGLIIKNWAKKYNRTPDAVIFEGPEAGGHLGFKEEQLDLAKEDFYKTIGEIKAELDGLSCPLIVGGGIASKEEAEKAISYGADGVQISTPFVVTKECDAPQSFKDMYLNAEEKDICIIKSPVGMPGRAIRNEFVKKSDKGNIPIVTCNKCIITCNSKDSPYCITEALLAAAKGDAENGLVFCGAKAYKLNKMTTVAEVIKGYL